MHTNTYKTLIQQCLQPQCSNREGLCVCLRDQCQSWHGWMPACEPPERGPRAQQIGTLHSFVPPACVCVHMCVCVVNKLIWYVFVCFFETLWLKVASAVEMRKHRPHLPPFPASSFLTFFLHLLLFSSLLSPSLHPPQPCLTIGLFTLFCCAILIE